MAPNKRFLYAQLRGQPYPVSTFSIDHATGKLTHIDTAPLVDQMAYLNVDKTGKHLLCASYVGAKMASYPIDALYVVEDKATQIIDTKPKAHCVFIDAANKHVYAPVLGGDDDHAVQVRRGERHADAERSAASSRPSPAPGRATSRSTRTASGAI